MIIGNFSKIFPLFSISIAAISPISEASVTVSSSLEIGQDQSLISQRWKLYNEALIEEKYEKGRKFTGAIAPFPNFHHYFSYFPTFCVRFLIAGDRQGTNLFLPSAGSCIIKRSLKKKIKMKKSYVRIPPLPNFHPHFSLFRGAFGGVLIAGDR